MLFFLTVLIFKKLDGIQIHCLSLVLCFWKTYMYKYIFLAWQVFWTDVLRDSSKALFIVQ